MPSTDISLPHPETVSPPPQEAWPLSAAIRSRLAHVPCLRTRRTPPIPATRPSRKRKATTSPWSSHEHHRSMMHRHVKTRPALRARICVSTNMRHNPRVRTRCTIAILTTKLRLLLDVRRLQLSDQPGATGQVRTHQNILHRFTMLLCIRTTMLPHIRIRAGRASQRTGTARFRMGATVGSRSLPTTTASRSTGTTATGARPLRRSRATMTCTTPKRALGTVMPSRIPAQSLLRRDWVTSSQRKLTGRSNVAKLTVPRQLGHLLAMTRHPRTKNRGWPRVKIILRRPSFMTMPRRRLHRCVLQRAKRPPTARPSRTQLSNLSLDMHQHGEFRSRGRS